MMANLVTKFMNQVQSLPCAVETARNRIVKSANNVLQISSLSYKELSEYLHHVNHVTYHLLKSSDERIHFGINHGTDSSIFWKATVRIICLRYSLYTGNIISYRVMTLNQFLQVFKIVDNDMKLTPATGSDECSDENEDNCIVSNLIERINSVLTENPKNNKEDSLSECSICYDRKPDMMLPCFHSFCESCIEQWISNNKTCPICRAASEHEELNWILPTPPECADIKEHLTSFIKGVANEGCRSPSPLVLVTLDELGIRSE